MMELSEEWKKHFPIGRTLNPPLLISSSSLGPLFFNPEPKSPPKCLFSSPSLFPPFLSPPSDHSLAGFLGTSAVPYSTSRSIGLLLGPNPLHDHISESFLSHNRLQLLHCPDHDIVLGFFSTGSNHDQVGFLLLEVQDGGLEAVGDQYGNGGVYVSETRFNHKIQWILVNKVDDYEGFTGSSAVPIVGYLMACSMYSVRWFHVQIDEFRKRPLLACVGFKLFKSCSIAGACWSPHLPQECVVLLESGALFLFDLELHAEPINFNDHLKGRRLRVKWEEWGESSQGKWLGCEFSWHPRILIIARSRAVFLVDLRADQCHITCLAKVEMLSLYGPVDKEKFLSFSINGFDAFQYVLASEGFLVLCDVRQPLSPLLYWAHDLDRPCHIDVFRLSKLRSQARDDAYGWANQNGFCIILGSFWNCEYRLFCFGPSLTDSGTSVASRTPAVCNALYSWGLPSDLSLSGRECNCGDCLVRKEFLNDDLPDQVVWQQKTEVVLGFAILDNDISKLLDESDDFDGFTLIRLMSSGKLEAQRYRASSELQHKLDAAHAEPSLLSYRNFIYSMGYEEYKFPKRFKYVNLKYLSAYLNGKLTEAFDYELKLPYNGPPGKDSSNLEFHEILCKKLNDCGFGRFRSSPVISLVFDDITLPTSIYEVAKRQLWATLPIHLLQLAFSDYSELLETLVDQKKVRLEFLVVPDLQQLPPFFLRKPSCRSNHSESFMGPALPLPFLLTLYEFHNGCTNSQDDFPFSLETELAHIIEEVMKVAGEVAISDSVSELQKDEAAFLADGDDVAGSGSQKSKSFYMYHPVMDESSVVDPVEDVLDSDEKHARLICKLNKGFVSNDGMIATGMKIFDDLCPVELKFEADADVTDFGINELEEYNLLKRQFGMWQRNFVPYRELSDRINGVLLS